MKASDGTTTRRQEQQTKTAGWQFNCAALYLREHNHHCGGFKCALNWKKKKANCTAPHPALGFRRLTNSITHYAGTRTVVLTEDNSPLKSLKGGEQKSKIQTGDP